MYSRFFNIDSNFKKFNIRVVALASDMFVCQFIFHLIFMFSVVCNLSSSNFVFMQYLVGFLFIFISALVLVLVN